MTSKDPQEEYNKSKALNDRVGNKYWRDSDINRPLQGQREQEQRKAASSGGSSCWVATAYYNDPCHDDVEALRAFRSRLISNPYCRPFVSALNRLYHKIGQSRLGQKWAESTSDKDKVSFPRYLSGRIVRALLWVSRK